MFGDSRRAEGTSAHLYRMWTKLFVLFVCYSFKWPVYMQCRWGWCFEVSLGWGWVVGGCCGKGLVTWLCHCNHSKWETLRKHCFLWARLSGPYMSWFGAFENLPDLFNTDGRIGTVVWRKNVKSYVRQLQSAGRDFRTEDETGHIILQNELRERRRVGGTLLVALRTYANLFSVIRLPAWGNCLLVPPLPPVFVYFNCRISSRAAYICVCLVSD